MFFKNKSNLNCYWKDEKNIDKTVTETFIINKISKLLLEKSIFLSLIFDYLYLNIYFVLLIKDNLMNLDYHLLYILQKYLNLKL